MKTKTRNKKNAQKVAQEEKKYDDDVSVATPRSSQVSAQLSSIGGASKEVSMELERVEAKATERSAGADSLGTDSFDLRSNLSDESHRIKQNARMRMGSGVSAIQKQSVDFATSSNATIVALMKTNLNNFPSLSRK